MAEGLDLSGGQSVGGLSGLTKKSKEMAYARNPLNNNELNLSSMEKKSGVVGQADIGAVSTQATGSGEAARQQKDIQAAQNDQTQKLQSSMGTLGLELQAAVNNFVSGAGSATANANMGGTATPVYNPTTGRYEMPTGTGQVEAGIGGVLSQKMAEQDVLRGKAEDLFGEGGKAKKFEDVLGKFADQNGNGVIDPDEQAFLNKSFGIVNALRRLKELNPSSPEADSLRLQLSLEDRDGLVSGILTSMDQFEELTGMKVSGSEGDEFQLQDLMNMGQEELKDQLTKAVSGSTGLFGGDFAAAMRRDVDESARQYTAAAKEDMTIMNKVVEESQNWLKEYDDAFAGQRESLNTMFAQSAQGILDDLEALRAEESTPRTVQVGGRTVNIPASDTTWIDQAKKWFVDLQNTVKDGGTDFATVVRKMLSSQSGLAPEARAMLEKWVGQTIGEDTVKKGKIADVLEQIQKTGMLKTVDEDGDVVNKPITSTAKNQILSIMSDEDLTSEEKSEAIQGVIDRATGKLGQDLKADSENIAELLNDGQLNTALVSFREAMGNSLKGFKNSLSQEFYKKLTDSGLNPQDIGPEEAKGWIQEKVATQKKDLDSAVELSRKAVKKMADDATRDAQEITTNLQKLEDIRTSGVAKAKENFDKAIADGMDRYRETLKNVLESYPGAPVGDLEGKVKAYSFIQLMNNNKGSPFYKILVTQNPALINYLNNPRMILGLTPSEAGSIRPFNEIMNQINFNTVFDASEVGQYYKANKEKMGTALDGAKKAITSANGIGSKLETAYQTAVTQLSSVLNMSPSQLFDAARGGQEVGFDKTTGTDNFIPDMGKIGNEAQYTEDATNIAADTSGIGNYIDPGMTGKETLAGMGYVAPKVKVTPESSGTPNKGAPVDPVNRGTYSETYNVKDEHGNVLKVVTNPGEHVMEALHRQYPQVGDTPITAVEKEAPIQPAIDAVSKAGTAVKNFFTPSKPAQKEVEKTPSAPTAPRIGAAGMKNYEKNRREFL